MSTSSDLAMNPASPGPQAVQEISVLFLTRYDRQGPSTRYRFLQYFDALREYGIRAEYSPLFDNSYIGNLYANGRARRLDFFRAFTRRLAALPKANRFDLVVVEKELVPYLPPVLEKWLSTAKVPWVVDFDDAIFHTYDQHSRGSIRWVLGAKIPTVMRGARAVIAGNRYIAEYARSVGARRVEVIPTVIDLSKYPTRRRASGAGFTIGWIGSPTSTSQLEAIAPALAEVCADGRGRVVLVGASEVELPGVPVEFVEWSEATEVDSICGFDVGIMPLEDGPWERGKCGFKLIQYMASWLPVVASPVGVNRELVKEGVNGFTAVSHSEWVHSLTTLRDQPKQAMEMGEAGRRDVEQRYHIGATVPHLAAVLRAASKTGSDARGAVAYNRGKS